MFGEAYISNGSRPVLGDSRRAAAVLRGPVIKSPMTAIRLSLAADVSGITDGQYHLFMADSSLASLSPPDAEAQARRVARSNAVV